MTAKPPHKITIETAADMMTHPVTCLRTDTEINDAAHTLVTKHIHGAPVSDASGALVGVISERDLLEVVATAAFHSLPTGTVADYMSSQPIAVEASDDIFKITKLFREDGVSRLPVMQDGRCVGIITRRNLLLALQRLARFHDKEPKRTYDLLAKLRG